MFFAVSRGVWVVLSTYSGGVEWEREWRRLGIFRIMNVDCFYGDYGGS